MRVPLSKVKLKKALILVDFGGPRNLEEISSFIRSLLGDREVIRTRLPSFLHSFLFDRIARKRVPSLKKQYAQIGGKSPIHENTETVADLLRKELSLPVHTFHRYLPNTHRASLEKIQSADADLFIVFPLFPQFTYAVTGSIATFFSQHLPPSVVHKMLWIKSYSSEEPFIRLFSQRITRFLEEKRLRESETVLFFSAHGLPRKFIEEGDPYVRECELSFQSISERFPSALSLLAYQSKFGPEEWTRPYTSDLCEELDPLRTKKKNLLFIPLSFTSDHIETLYEVEQEYMPVSRQKGFSVFRLPAFNMKSDWIHTVQELLETPYLLTNQMLIRKK